MLPIKPHLLIFIENIKGNSKAEGGTIGISRNMQALPQILKALQEKMVIEDNRQNYDQEQKSQAREKCNKTLSPFWVNIWMFNLL